ncbi:hypothetical protein QQS21_007485 [Conoideocrella luteorostrata]|uniref:Uncharacterized protein n=1 Tax=Conoideocrella luteorostrata TaxID=1105319 RepID=A0AAJ0CN11_9HYPO|nr:hypothetical protein QQS21_007485 [Conoideocrella luteorostrata]
MAVKKMAEERDLNATRIIEATAEKLLPDSSEAEIAVEKSGLPTATVIDAKEADAVTSPVAKIERKQQSRLRQEILSKRLKKSLLRRKRVAAATKKRNIRSLWTQPKVDDGGESERTLADERHPSPVLNHSLSDSGERLDPTIARPLHEASESKSELDEMEMNIAEPANDEGVLYQIEPVQDTQAFMTESVSTHTSSEARHNPEHLRTHAFGLVAEEDGIHNEATTPKIRHINETPPTTMQTLSGHDRATAHMAHDQQGRYAELPDSETAFEKGSLIPAARILLPNTPTTDDDDEDSKTHVYGLNNTQLHLLDVTNARHVMTSERVLAKDIEKDHPTSWSHCPDPAEQYAATIPLQQPAESEEASFLGATELKIAPENIPLPEDLFGGELDEDSEFDDSEPDICEDSIGLPEELPQPDLMVQDTYAIDTEEDQAMQLDTDIQQEFFQGASIVGSFNTEMDLTLDIEDIQVGDMGDIDMELSINQPLVGVEQHCFAPTDMPDSMEIELVNPRDLIVPRFPELHQPNAIPEVQYGTPAAMDEVMGFPDVEQEQYFMDTLLESHQFNEEFFNILIEPDSSTVPMTREQFEMWEQFWMHEALNDITGVCFDDSFESFTEALRGPLQDMTNEQNLLQHSQQTNLDTPVEYTRNVDKCMELDDGSHQNPANETVVTTDDISPANPETEAIILEDTKIIDFGAYTNTNDGDGFRLSRASWNAHQNFDFERMQREDDDQTEREIVEQFESELAAIETRTLEQEKAGVEPPVPLTPEVLGSSSTTAVPVPTRNNDFHRRFETSGLRMPPVQRPEASSTPDLPRTVGVPIELEGSGDEEEQFPMKWDLGVTSPDEHEKSPCLELKADELARSRAESTEKELDDEETIARRVKLTPKSRLLSARAIERQAAPPETSRAARRRVLDVPKKADAQTMASRKIGIPKSRLGRLVMEIKEATATKTANDPKEDTGAEERIEAESCGKTDSSRHASSTPSKTATEQEPGVERTESRQSKDKGKALAPTERRIAVVSYEAKNEMSRGREETGQGAVAPMNVGGLMFPGGNFIHPAAPEASPATPTHRSASPMTPNIPRTPGSQSQDTTDKLQRQKERYLRMKNKPVSLFHDKSKRSSSSTSYGTRAIGSVERDEELKGTARLLGTMEISSPGRSSPSIQSDGKGSGDSPRGIKIIPTRVLRAMRAERSPDEDTQGNDASMAS